MSTATFEFEQSESIESSGGKYANKPGKFHFMITGATVNPPKKDGTPLMDCLQVDMEIVAGTDPTQVGKTFEAKFWKGKQDDKDGGEMANKKLSCLAVALGGQHTPHGKGGIDVANITSRQIVAELAFRLDTNNKERLDISYANIYHIDDDRVKDVPKNQEYLGLVPKSFRRETSAPANTVAKASQTTQTTVQTASALSEC